MADYFEEARQTDTTMRVTTADTTTETTAPAAPSTEGPTIMAYPPGVSLATITIGAGRTMFGAPPKLISATVTPIFVGTPHVVHAASGWAFYPSPQTFRVENGEELTFELPHVNAEGWRDTAGNEFPALLESGERDRGWAYHAKFTVIGGSGQDAIPHRYEKVFQPLVGQTEPLDLDLVPDGQIGTPVSAPIATVSSVLGFTGPVTREQLEAAGLGATSDTDIAGLVQDDTTATAMALWSIFASKDEAATEDTEIAELVQDSTTSTSLALAALYAPTNGRRPVGKGELEIHVKDYGVKGDGVTDDAPAIQLLIDSLGAGGLLPSATLYFSPGDFRVAAPIVLRDGVFLTGRRPGYGYLASGTKWTTRLRAIGALAAIVTGPATIANAGVQGIDFEGGGTASKGIHFVSASWCQIRDVHMNNFLDQFILIEGGNACGIDNFLGINGLRRAITERTARIGSIQLGGSDHWLSRMESGGGYTPGSMTAGGLNCAYYFTGTSMFLSDLVGEFSETGFWFAPSAVGNRGALLRADKGGGHGFVIEAKDNLFTGCHVANMSREADNVYSGFRVTSGGRGSNFSACRVHYTSGYNNWVKYAFEDLTDGGSMQDRPEWAACTGQYRTAMFYTVPGGGSAPRVGSHPQRYAANQVSLDVTNTGIGWLGSYSNPTTITSLTGGVTAQRVVLMTSNTNVSIAHNGSVNVPGSINTNTSATKTLSPNVAYEFVHYQGIWYELA